MKLYDYITKRKSTRKYTQEALPSEQLATILAFAGAVRPLDPQIRTRIRLADAAETKGIVSAKAPHYLLFYSEKREGFLTNAGFMLQQCDLFLSSLGLGSCWLGMAKTKAPAQDGLEFVIMLAFGTAQDSAHRTNSTEFSRKPLSEISSGQDPRLEAVRLAPSATNSQPWYFVCGDGRIDVYRRQLGVLKAALYDTMNQIDMGIALSHLWLASEALSIPFAFAGGPPKDAAAVAGYACIGRVEG